MNVELNLKSGESGEWKLKRFTVTPQGAKMHNWARYSVAEVDLSLPVNTGVYFAMGTSSCQIPRQK